MTQFLPPNLLALFAPRDPIPFRPPTTTLSWEKDRSKNPYTGLGDFTGYFEDPKDTPPPTRGETKSEKKQRRMREKNDKRKQEVEDELKLWDPHTDPNAIGDAFKTLFVSRINFDTSDSKLRREFEKYGKIKKINMIKNAATGKPRGYAFIEFEKERDMHAAYKSADGSKIDGRRVLVDVERGRTVKGWRPRRLGGGLGDTRAIPTEEAVAKEPERDDGRSDSRARDRSRGRGEESSRHESSGRRERERGSDRDRESRRGGDRDRGGERSSGRSERDRGDRGERGDRSERGERGDRGDRGERGDRSERSERGDRSERGERGEKVRESRGDRDRTDKSGKRDRDRSGRDRERPERSSKRGGDEEGKEHKRSSKRDRSREKDRSSRRDRDRGDKDASRSRTERENKSEQSTTELKSGTKGQEKENLNGQVDKVAEQNIEVQQATGDLTESNAGSKTITKTDENTNGDVKMEEAKDGEDTSKIDGDGEIKEGETLAKEVVSTDVDMNEEQEEGEVTQ